MPIVNLVRFLLPTLLVLHLAGKLLAAEPQHEQSVIFASGDDGYPHFRIPGIVATRSGALLAYCEARQGNDWSAIDIVLRRSTDGGRTWSKMRKIANIDGPHQKHPLALKAKAGKPGDVTYNNPLAIADPNSDLVHFFFCLEYARCFYRQSADQGQSFSDPIEITSTFNEFRDHYEWAVLATGPGHGIRLTNGRLVVPIWLSKGTGGNAHRPSVIATIYSDNQGAVWQRGAIITGEKDPLVNPSEFEVAELADGAIMANIRSEAPPNRRAVSISSDGAIVWSRPKFDDTLVDPICMASLCRVSTTPTSDRNRLLFSNPANLERAKGDGKPGQSRDRKNLTVRLSYDEGESWAVAKTLEPGPSAYSDLAVGPDGTIYCLYETRDEAGKNSIRLARFNLEWLTDGKDRLPMK